MKTLSEKLKEMYVRMGESERLAVADKMVIRSAIELARRVETAPVAELLGECPEASCFYHISPNDGQSHKYIAYLGEMRVAIVPLRRGE